MKYYAVKRGRTPGIYTNWPECKEQVDGFTGAVFKSFLNEDEAHAFMKKPVPKWAKSRPPIDSKPTRRIVFEINDTIVEQEETILSPEVEAKIEKCLRAIARAS